DRHGLPVHGLINAAIIADEKAAFGDVALRRGRREGDGRFFLGVRYLQRRVLRQAVDGALQLLGEIAAADDAVGGVASIESVLAGPAAEDHFGMTVEIAIDRNVGTLNSQ